MHLSTIKSQRTSSSGNLQIFGIYRNLRKSPDEFIAENENQILNNANRRLIITRDFNIDLLNEKKSQHLLNIFMSHDLESHVNEPTRTGINMNNLRTETCIDHFYSRGE
jgi:hypothetical protein